MCFIVNKRKNNIKINSTYYIPQSTLNEFTGSISMKIVLELFGRLGHIKVDFFHPDDSQDTRKIISHMSCLIFIVFH